jgi:hypothetical protein
MSNPEITHAIGYIKDETWRELFLVELNELCMASLLSPQLAMLLANVHYPVQPNPALVVLDQGISIKDTREDGWRYFEEVRNAFPHATIVLLGGGVVDKDYADHANDKNVLVWKKEDGLGVAFRKALVGVMTGADHTSN